MPRPTVRQERGALPRRAARLRRARPRPLPRARPQGRPRRRPGRSRRVGERALAHRHPGADARASTSGPEPTPFQRAQRLAAEAWGARRSWFLINGASQGNHVRCLALAHMGERGGGAAQRRTRARSTASCCPACGPRFVGARARPRAGASPTASRPRRSTGRSRDTPGAVAAQVVSPTYFGAVADVAGAGRGRPRARRAAGGRRGLGRAPRLPRATCPTHALALGADLVISSTHKIVGSLTQSAMLHLGHGEPARRGGDRPLRDARRVDQPELAARRVARRRAPARRGRTASELLDETLRGAGRDPRGDPRDPGPRRARRAAGGPPGRLRLRPAAARRSTCAAPAPRGYEIAPLLRELDDVNLELFAENVIVAVFGMGEPAARAGRAAGHGAAARGRPAAAPSASARARRSRRRRPGASWR